jgi:SAM-dependent methyltransferase
VTEEYRFYGDLAPWWPLISPPEDYTEEAAFSARLLASAEISVRNVLELGSGGGHSAFHLRRSFTMTLVDLSPAMLEVSKELNPDCEHLLGDMRSVRLGRQFDAVFVHDAVAYMTNVMELRQAMETAFVHCRPGGLALFAPDETTETFEPATEHGGTDGEGGRGVRYLAWSWDPDPTDSWTETEYAFLLRSADGSVDVAHETHRNGLFPRATWLELLNSVGFDTSVVVEETTEDRTPRDLFVGRRPRNDP